MTADIQTTNPEDFPVLPATDPSDASLERMLRQARGMQAAHQIGTALAATSMVPQHFQGKPDDAAAAIMHGNELGLPAIQSLQQIFVVRGKPAMYARAMVAIILSKGHRIFEVAASADSVTWAGIRRDTGDEITATWTIERAQQAGFTSNKLYESQPVEMLRAKAQSEVARNLFPDVLLGMSAREDLELQEDTPRRVRNEATAPGVEDLRGRLGIAAAPKPAPEPEAPAAEAAAAVGESTESETAAPSKDDLKRFTALFARAGITGNSAAAKAKRKTVTEKLIERTVEDDTPLTADECLHVIGQLEALVAQGDADGRGDAVLVDTVSALSEADGDA